MRIVGILLAAGRGARFGGDKLLALLPDSAREPPGRSVGTASAMHIAAALPDSIAVVRPGDEQLSGALRDAGLRIVECANADDGMGASLACGVISTCDADGWIVALADMPWIASTTIRAIADSLASGADIVAPAYRGSRGHPVGFSRRHFAALCASTGDAGARSVLLAHSDELTLLDVDDEGVVRDVDTASDLLLGVNAGKSREV